MLIVVGDFKIMTSLFFAFIVAVLAGISLLFGFAGPAPKANRASDIGKPHDAAIPVSPIAEVTDAEIVVERKMPASVSDGAEDIQIGEVGRVADEAETEIGPDEIDTPAEQQEFLQDFGEPIGAEQDEGTSLGTKPRTYDEPPDGKADDLKRIMGIGPKLEEICNSLGIWRYDQIAAWTPEEVDWVDSHLKGFPGRVSRDDWVNQARILASGGSTDFSRRADND